MNYLEIQIVFESNPEDFAEIFMAELSESGFESFTSEGANLFAYIPHPEYKKVKADEIFDRYRPYVNFRISERIIKSENWNKNWESNFSPVIIEDRCIIRAPFHQPVEGMEFEIVIEPKMSFGTGHHETTGLMISYLLSLDLKDKIVLDMGCGTGILAILTSLKGAKEIDAIDIDEWAFTNTIENVDRNRIKNIKVLKGGVDSIPDKKYDLILANINKNILLEDCKRYVSHLNSKSQILFSGIYENDFIELENVCNQHNLKFIDKSIKNKWIATRFDLL